MAPKQVLDIVKYVNEGKIEEAQKIYWNLAPLTRVIGDEANFPSLLKKAVELTGHAAGDPRLPMIPATDEETAEIEEALKIAGVK